MLADLHIHSKYSSHALYINDKGVLDILRNKYPEHELFNEKPHLLSRLIIDGTSHITHILTMAQKKGIKCIAITDHNTTVGSLEAQSLSEKYGIIVVPGMELSTDSGELLCYGITSKIDKGLPISQAISEVHRQGGIAIVAHPFNRRHPNIDFRRIDEKVFLNLNIDGIEVFNQIKGEVDEYFLELARQHNLAITGGSDAHILYQLGKGLTILPDSCKTWQDVIEAIKNKENTVTGEKLNYYRVFIDMLWCNTIFGRMLINRKWGNEIKNKKIR